MFGGLAEEQKAGTDRSREYYRIWVWTAPGAADAPLCSLAFHSAKADLPGFPVCTVSPALAYLWRAAVNTGRIVLPWWPNPDKLHLLLHKPSSKPPLCQHFYAAAEPSGIKGKSDTAALHLCVLDAARLRWEGPVLPQPRLPTAQEAWARHSAATPDENTSNTTLLQALIAAHSFHQEPARNTLPGASTRNILVNVCRWLGCCCL